MKKAIQAILQRWLGFERYLFWFCRFKLATFRWESHRKEGDFKHFLSLLSPQDNVLDLGANIGIMTVQLAWACPKGRIVAVEPVPENFRTLQRIIQHFQLGNVVLKQLALGEENGTLTMKMPVMNGVRMQGLAYVNDQRIEGYMGDTDAYEVAVKRLDDMGLLRNFPVNAIKIDVENYEQFVLKGGKMLLARDRPMIYCELWPNENRHAVFELLHSLDYDAMVLEGKALQLFRPEVHTQHNFFFLPRDRSFPS